ncbi:MAG: NosD domain-containing protein [Candidatus Odinarchaeota archaeon]
MKVTRKIYPGLAIVLLIVLFPAVITHSSDGDVFGDHQAASGPVIQAKLTGIQALPIVITDNDGFTAAGFTGSGTATVPYVLKDVVIDAGGPNGIDISNTDKYFRIENVTVSGSTNVGAGAFWLANVKNGLIINCTATSSYAGFAVTGSSRDNTLADNNATGNDYGFLLDTAHDNTFTGNNATDNGWFGFYLESSDNNTLIGNNAHNTAGGEGEIGFYLASSDNNTLTGNNATSNDNAGFYLYSSHNNTLTGNNAALNGQNGFYLWSSRNNTLTGNEASGNTYEGFALDSSDNNTLAGNDATDNGGLGFLLGGSYNNTLTGNNASGNDVGFLLDTAVNNTLTGNNASGNNYGFLLGDSNNNTLTGNEASGNADEGFSLYVSRNNTLSGSTASGNRNGFVLSDSHNNTLTGNTATGSKVGSGFIMDNSHNNTLTGNNASGNNFGFDLSGSDYNTFTGNSANNNFGATSGFYLSSSDYNNFTGNTANGNYQHGFDLSTSHNNTFTGNTASNNTEGFELDYSHNNTLTGNTAAGNRNFGFYLSNCDNTTLSWNTLYNNTNCGVYLWSCSYDQVYLNFFIDNNKGGTTIQGYDNSLDNSWDNGTYGNHWSDHTGMDNYTLDGGLKVNDTLPLVPALLKYLSILQFTGPGPDDQVFEAGTTGILSLTWLPVTNIPVNTTYELYLDDNLEESGNWTSGIALTLAVDLTGISPDDHNITIVISDYSNKTAADTVWMTVEDTTDPVITPIADFTEEAGPAAGTLVFSATDLFPDTYTLYLDDAVNQTGSWTSGTVVTVELDGFLPGDYNFTLVVRDTTGNEAKRTVLVTLEDTTDPVITYTGTETFTFEEGSTGNAFNITATDLYPGNFTLYQNGTGAGTYNWTSGTTVTVSFDSLSLPVGVYNFTLVVRDTSGNGATLMVTVTVTAKPAPSTTTTTPTSSSSVTTTTTGKPSPGWTAPLVLLFLACSAGILARRRSRREK